jgi:hypothetical protein
MVFAVSGTILLKSVRTTSPKHIYKLPFSSKFFNATIYTIQILMISILLLIILQIMLFQEYNIGLLHAATYLTHISALIFLVSLVFMFIGWLRSKRNYIIILYSVSLILVSLNVIVSFIYIESYLYRTRNPGIVSYPIHAYVSILTAIPWSQFLVTLFDILSISSFLVIWIATVSLLKQYRNKLGRIKFIGLLSLPLIYYLFPFQSYFGNVFSPLILNSPITFGVIYVLTFSATTQVGAFMFSLSFWTASALVSQETVRKSLLVSAMGMAMLFGSIEITPLNYKIFPPFGLVTEAFMPLGSYLLFIGIFTSATSVSRDAQVRKEFYKSAMSQLSLLKTIGVTQMEKELEKKLRTVEKRTRMLETTDSPYAEEGDVKEILRDVLNELYSKNREEKK